MTTSPSPAEVPSVPTTSGSTTGSATASASGSATASTTGLSDERASSIGWFFITSYYEFYNTNVESIHKIYHQQASISHSQFPCDDESEDAKIIHRAQGLDAIKSRFQNDSKLSKKNSNRIVITSAAFEVSLSKNILIVVFGEWSKDSSPYYQFTQTFVLTPGKKENTFDVANDVLRFIDYSEFKGDSEQAKEKEVIPNAEVINEDKEEVKEEIKEDVKEEVKEEKDVEVAEEITEESKEEVEIPEVGEVKVEDNKAEEPVEVTEEESKPSQPLSWAALASQAAPPKSASKAVPNVPKTVAAPAKKPVATLPNGKFKKEEWFPIYIRGIKEINEKHLKDHIAKKFGELKFFKTSLNIALCDFVALDAQKKALEAKETVIDGTTIYLEPRESKTGNNYHATSKKFKDQKDKPVAEIKRTKSEKKPTNPKKPNRPVTKKE